MVIERHVSIYSLVRVRSPVNIPSLFPWYFHVTDVVHPRGINNLHSHI